jgi:ComF family protein
MQWIIRILKRAAYWLYRFILDYALPPRCPGCGVVTADDHQFCATCWLALDFMGEPLCTHCGLPVESAQMLCAPCMAKRPRHDFVHAVTSYNEVARQVVLRLKYSRRIGHARTMGQFIAMRLPALTDTLIIPVPLHYWRIWKRGYNQSALIARTLVKMRGGELLLDGLERVKNTRPLAGLTRKKRLKELRAAFRVAPQHKAKLKGRRVLLVDDVFTTGTTINRCAHMLKAAGAREVQVAVWARVIAQGYESGIDNMHGKVENDAQDLLRYS